MSTNLWKKDSSKRYREKEESREKSQRNRKIGQKQIENVNRREI